MARRQSTTVLEKAEMPDAVASWQGAKERRDRHRQVGIVLPSAAIASVLVAIVTVVAYLVSPNGSGAGNLSSALGTLPNSKSISLLAHEEQQIRVMHAATSVMAVAAKPKVVSPAQIQAQKPQVHTQPATTASSGTSSSSSASTSSGSSTGTSGTSAEGSGFEPTPAEAQTLAQELMPQFGFSVSSQWSCLQDLWQKESSWEWDAQNVSSGAYGIPQSLPASKMASVASDYMTNATTQMKWGLGYIQSVYGTPCAADAHEIADHNY